MPVIFKCNCGNYLMVANKYIGQKLQCLECHAILAVPTPEKNKTTTINHKTH